ncbi:NAC domain-containing protein 19 [Abeliophyllum distichum]|uniref:NAC domain-containing protein 19 n=1 Tax=Abeliophyllum distichum TaxID=126358 RepID=A0ABD1T2I4_9LAMI
MSMAVNTVPGFYITPTDEDLITFYLKPKAMRQSLPWDGILEKNLYEDNAMPWVILTENDWEISQKTARVYENSVSKDEIYVFTKLKKIAGLRFVRVAGSGYWDDNQVITKIKNRQGEIVGIKKSFTFKVKGGKGQEKIDHKEKGRWIMHEYTLAGVSLVQEVKDSDYAICRIFRDLSKCRKNVAESSEGRQSRLDIDLNN